MLALTLGTFWVVQGIRLQQLSLLVAPMVAASIYFLTRNRQVASGILLGLATIKPQIALPLAAWLMLWASARISNHGGCVAAVDRTVAEKSCFRDGCEPYAAMIAYRVTLASLRWRR